MTNDNIIANNNVPEFFQYTINPDMIAKDVNASLREAIVGVIITNTSCGRRIDISGYEQLLAVAKRFYDASCIFILKDDKQYKEFSFGCNDDLTTMKALQELLSFFTITEAYYENNYNTIMDRKSYSGFYYKSNIGDIAVVCHANTDIDF